VCEYDSELFEACKERETEKRVGVESNRETHENKDNARAEEHLQSCRTAQTKKRKEKEII